MNSNEADAEEILRLIYGGAITARENKAILEWAAKQARKILKQGFINPQL